MATGIETHRGMVKAWECDSFGHFTVAYYFDRFADASAALLEALGRENALPAPRSWRSAEFLARFAAELRGGEVLHIESGIVAAERDALVFGHRVLNSATGKAATTVEERLALAPGAPALTKDHLAGLDAFRIPWESTKDDGDYGDRAGAGFIEGGLDRVKPGEVDETGHLALASHIHRTGSGCIHLLAAMGLSPDYLRAARRGFSTFEIKLRLMPPGPLIGDGVRVQTGLLHLGSSSMRMIHRLCETGSGRCFATARQSGVHFDLEARRSTPLPPELRAKAAGFLLGAKR